MISLLRVSSVSSEILEVFLSKTVRYRRPLGDGAQKAIRLRGIQDPTQLIACLVDVLQHITPSPVNEMLSKEDGVSILVVEFLTTLSNVSIEIFGIALPFLHDAEMVVHAHPMSI